MYAFSKFCASDLQCVSKLSGCSTPHFQRINLLEPVASPQQTISHVYASFDCLLPNIVLQLRFFLSSCHLALIECPLPNSKTLMHLRHEACADGSLIQHKFQVIATQYRCRITVCRPPLKRKPQPLRACVGESQMARRDKADNLRDS